jgi:hypothetical protein
MRTPRAAIAIAIIALAACKKNDTTSVNESTKVTPSSSPSASTHALTRKGDRPPKPKSITHPPTPKLPKLADQAAPEKPKKGTGKKLDDDYPCGTVWTGDEDIPVECTEPVDASKFDPPAVALIPYELLHTAKESLPETVDHRTDGFEGPTLNQGKTPSCTAHAMATIVDHDLALWTGKPGNLSVMEIWARYHQANTEIGILSNMGKSIANADDWPYDSATASSWLPKGKSCKADACGKPVDEAKLAELEKKGVVLVEQHEVIAGGDTLFDVIEAKLASGHDVGVGGKLPASFKPVGETGSKYIPDFKEYGKGGHAFATVGYARVDGERYFLLKNSWGEKWGDGGYAWIHEATLKKIIGGAHVLILDPVLDVGLKKPKRKKGHVPACKSGEAPDSADQTCAPKCADGSPQHAGYCAVTEDCDKGFVNLLGECVLAAPTAKGTEPKSNISYTCTASGCVYAIPKGVEGCEASGCEKSCPAPDYRLGKGKGGLLCLE